MTTVVTGASGHLGGNVVRQLLAEGHEVRALVNRSRDALEGLDVQEAPGNIMDPVALEAAFKGANTVIHLAAKISITGDKDGSVKRINVDGARNVAEAALEADAKMVHVSSVHAFDLRQPGVVTEESKRAGPQNYAYDHSKFLGEQEVRACMAEGLDATIVNPTGIIGPYDFAPSRMGKVLLDLRAQKVPALVAGGFDFVDVRDVAAGVIAAATPGNAGENFLLGGHHISVRQIAQQVAKLTGAKAPKIVLPLWLATLGVPFAKLAAKGRDPEFTTESLGALRHGREVDHAKATRVLGYQTRSTVETLRDTFSWFDGALP